MRFELNPADYASRGIKPSKAEKLDRWSRGPALLWKDVAEWPTQPPEVLDDLLDNDEGVKKTTPVGETTVQADFWDRLFYKYSTWKRLRRVVAWLLRVVHTPVESRPHLKRNGIYVLRPEPLTVSEVDKAEKKIVQFVQNQSFASENKETVINGRLARLKPFEDEGILPVGGRLNHSDLPYDAKHPMILPVNHPVPGLIVRHYHHLNGHVGSYQVLAEVRQRFWIVNVVSTIKRFFSKCHVCKRQSAKLGEQITGPLPVVRVSSDSHRIIYPFAVVGLDYSARFCASWEEEALLRSSTAITVRISGEPSWMWPRPASLNRRGIDWKMNPPAASSQGGVWERLIRSIRRILHLLVGERLVTDEQLRTFLVDVEKMLNDRPITPVSSDPLDLEALTPSRILLLRQNSSLPPDTFEESDRFKARCMEACSGPFEPVLAEVD